MARDDRKLNGTLAVPVASEPGAKVVGAQFRYFGPADDPDEVEQHLTADEVKRHSEPDPETGKALMEGKWAGKLKERAPMLGSKKAKAMAEREAQAAAIHRASGHKAKE
jgi:hypothetical protein